MTKFYLLIWLRWAFRVSICSLLMAGLLSFVITLFIYLKQSSPALDAEVISALLVVFKFWFPLFWSITLLLALFRSLKYVFNTCNNGYEFKLLECNKTQMIDIIGYGDLVKVWRKWFMSMIWLVASQMIIALILSYALSLYESVFDWFDIYFLFVFILVAGYFSFILLGGRCKKVKVMKC